MKKSEVEVGGVYRVKVSGSMVPVILVDESPYGGWVGRNTRTGRKVRIRTAARLRGRLSNAASEERYNATIRRKPLFQCQECRKKYYTVGAAEKAAHDGCTKCGGVDIDLYVEG